MCGNFNRHAKPIESLSYVYPLAVSVSNRLLQMILVHFGIDAGRISFYFVNLIQNIKEYVYVTPQSF